MNRRVSIVLIVLLFFISLHPNLTFANSKNSHDLKYKQLALQSLTLPKQPKRFVYHSSLEFNRPEAVRGIYVTAYSAGGSRMDSLINLIDHSDLNSVVIDIKDDRGNITFQLPKDSALSRYSKPIIRDPKALLKKLQQHHIYPIARIVVFKDTVLANSHPNYSFTEKNSKTWKNGNGDKFVSPFIKDVWKYNVQVAKEAIKLGFQEVQFDYVRFPEGFEKRSHELKYNLADYNKTNLSDVQKRVQAVTDFVTYAQNELKPYDIPMSVDIFGYTATLPEAPGIGQNFTKIAQHVDVISSMIYPSHWTSYFGIQYPDKRPYDLVNAYAKVEKTKLAQLTNPPISRPWIQDFTATWLGSGHYIQYGKKQVEDQIKALQNNGIHEFLVWDAANSYTPNVDYTP